VYLNRSKLFQSLELLCSREERLDWKLNNGDSTRGKQKGLIQHERPGCRQTAGDRDRGEWQESPSARGQNEKAMAEILSAKTGKERSTDMLYLAIVQVWSNFEFKSMQWCNNNSSSIR